jgi:hypothetical protein
MKFDFQGGVNVNQFFNMYILSNCYQLVTNEAIWFWDLVQLLLDNGTLS